MAVTSEQHQVYSSEKNFGYYARITYEVTDGTVKVTKIEMAQDSTSYAYDAYYEPSQDAYLYIGNATHKITASRIARKNTSWYTPIEGEYIGYGGGPTRIIWTCRCRSSAPNQLTFTWDVGDVKPSNVSINPIATSGTTVNLQRNWSNATICQYKIKVGNSWSGWINEQSYYGDIYFDANNVTGLSIGTTYNFKVRFKNGNSDWTDSGEPSVTTWKIPTISRVDISPGVGSFDINVIADGDGSYAPITNYTLYYRTNSSSGAFNSVSMGVSSNITINSGLSVDTDYQIYVAVTNSVGTATSNVQIKATRMGPPNISTIEHSETPFTSTVIIDASILPSKPLKYQFRLNGGTWSEPQAPNMYTFENLNEETSYTGQVMVIAEHQSEYGDETYDTIVEGSYDFITPADQARIRIKTDNGWIQGKAYVKINDEWVKAKKIYIKANDEWLLGKNQ